MTDKPKTWFASFSCANCYHEWGEAIPLGHTVENTGWDGAREHWTVGLDVQSRTIRCPNCATHKDTSKVKR